jgi:hypothetical protein
MAVDISSAEVGEPLIFRTTSSDVCEVALNTGSLWLRSDQYYRDLEDKVRNDDFEGVNSGAARIPIRVRAGGANLQIEGDGQIGQVIVPHYILSLHGTSLSRAQ